jgi:hypothetical protein
MMMSWDCLLGLTTEFTEGTEAEKRGKKLMFLYDRECSRFNLSPLFSVSSVVKFFGWLWVRF